MALSPDLTVPPEASLREALAAITRNSRQAVAVAGTDGRLLGLVTDGDLRRAILRGVPLDAPVSQVMNRNPVLAPAGTSRDEALALLRRRLIRHLPLVEADGRLADLVLLDDLLEPRPLPNRAVLMAGGDGKRLRPLTESVPKPLLRVGGKPLLEILVERLRGAGVREFYITVHHKSHMIEEHFGDGSRLDVRVRYVREPEPLGTAGALTLLEERPGEPFFLVNGDILTKCDFRGLLDFHGRSGAEMTVGAVRHAVDLPYGVIEVEGERLARVAEKPQIEFLINGGIYVVEPRVIDLIPRGRFFDATDLLGLLLGQGRPVAAFLIRDYWLDVGRHDDLRKADRALAEGLLD
jgi:dTDP-glucose pyrophosphorylase